MLLMAFALAGCGKLGPPQPPGPPEQVTYPHGYPTPPKTAGTPAAAPAGTPTGMPTLEPSGLPTPTTLPGAPIR
jgi:hypothetical protein